MKPKDHVPQLQVHLPPLFLLFLALLSLSPRLLPMSLPTCIYSVMSCPVPSSPLILAHNETCPKSLLTPHILSLMNLFMNICHPEHVLHLELQEKSGLFTRKGLRAARKRGLRQKSQRGMKGRRQCLSESKRNQQGEALKHAHCTTFKSECLIKICC